MSALLPALRTDVELIPSPVAAQPGLLLRDPMRYADGIMLVPPLLAACLRFFDGRHSKSEIQAALATVASEHGANEALDHMVDTLGERGFLDDAEYAGRRERRHRAFATAAVREAAHAGASYSAERQELTNQLDGWLAEGAATAGEVASEAGLIGIAAPHVSPAGGPAAYGAAYARLGTDLGDRVFVVLGTSHYGPPNRFGLTRKPFQTPLGTTTAARETVDAVAAAGGGAFELEDYCHAVEHSIEFQVLFLQRLYGPGVRVLPILCGPLLSPPGGLPEADPSLAQAFSALRDLAARQGDALFWIVAADLAHVGRRYGDETPAGIDDPATEHLAKRDRERLQCVSDADAGRLWSLIQEGGQDDLRWCGSSPIYSFMRAVPSARGALVRYDRWNIDPASMVTFAAMTFVRS